MSVYPYICMSIIPYTVKIGASYPFKPIQWARLLELFQAARHFVQFTRGVRACTIPLFPFLLYFACNQFGKIGCLQANRHHCMLLLILQHSLLLLLMEHTQRKKLQLRYVFNVYICMSLSLRDSSIP